MLLGDRAAYRARWAALVEKTSDDEISQAAVAKVIVEHLREDGQDGQTDYRLLKDRVCRALSGRTLTPSMLRLFVEAFRFSQEDTRHLWALFLGARTDEARVLLDRTPATSLIRLSFEEVDWLRAKLAGDDTPIASAIITKLG